MNPPQKPVRPPPPLQVPKDHLVDANKMVETPRTDGGMEYDASNIDDVTNFARQLERELAAANSRVNRLEQQLTDAKGDAATWAEQSERWEKMLLEKADEIAAANAEVARLKETLSDILPALEWASGCSAKDLASPGNALTADEVAALWMARAIMERLDWDDCEAANARIRLLISERDTARMQADRNYKLREEFVGLLGTDDIERGVEVVKALKSKVDYLQNWIRRLEVIEANPTEHRRWCGEIGWLNPGQCVFVGLDKPEGLR